MKAGSSEDELGVNDQYFDFKRYKFPGVQLNELEDPELLQELFPEQYME